MSAAPHRIGIDTGGTFTDVIALVPGRSLVVHKLPSTPDDPALAVLRGVAAVLPPGGTADLVHGTTVGINAVLTGQLPRTAFVTNAGFEDVIEIGRQARADIYDLTAQRPMLPVSRALRFGVDTRRSAAGEPLARPGQAQLGELRKRLRRARVDAVAIGLLFGFAHPGDEREIAAALGSVDVPITCSGDLLPIAGEYERFAAAILNAAMTPIMGQYIERLRRALSPGRVRLLRSSGGIMPAQEAARFPIRAALSGPAGGVGACRALQRRLRCGAIAAFDMGGTSTDVCLIDAEGETSRDHAATLAGLPLAVPTVAVHTVGCGGGSIARVDAGGALRVGPMSAGADPGPACYGKGDQPTVTDAHVALGHIAAATLLGGAFPIEPQRSVRALQPLARRLGVSVRRAAEGILEVADNAMLRALLVITAARAIDPSKVSLIAYGGAGGMHAASLATMLAMPQAIVPAHPGAFSAVGLALATESADALVPVHRPLQQLGAARLHALAQRVIAMCTARLEGRGRVTEALAHVRARGQGATLAIPLRGDLEQQFRRHHRRRFGFEPAASELELVAVSARAEGTPRRLPDVATARGPMPAAVQRRPPVGGASLAVHGRAELPDGAVLKGPAVVEEPTGVVVLPPGWCATIRPFGIHLERC